MRRKNNVGKQHVLSNRAMGVNCVNQKITIGAKVDFSLFPNLISVYNNMAVICMKRGVFRRWPITVRVETIRSGRKKI